MAAKKNDDSVEPTVEEQALTAEAAAAEAAADAVEQSEAPAETVIDYAAHQEDVVEAPVLTETAPVEPVAAADSAPQTVYVTLPAPPTERGNRGFGVLIAVLATLVFAVLYTGVSWFVLASTIAAGQQFTLFFLSPLFYIPVVVFFVAMVIYTLLANRAAWWSWVIGSAFIGVAVFFGAIGATILFGQVITGAVPTFAELAGSLQLLAAALIGREVSLWFGAMISARGRKVKERNRVARADHEREVAELRASYGQSA